MDPSVFLSPYPFLTLPIVICFSLPLSLSALPRIEFDLSKDTTLAAVAKIAQIMIEYVSMSLVLSQIIPRL